MTDAPVQIDVRLRQLAQLFNSMDSAPFNERDLDADAEEFIVSSATEASTSHEIELVMHLMEPPVKSALAVEDAVRHFFRERARIKRLEFKKLLRQGRFSLPIGLMFLAACLTLGEVIGSFGDGRAVVIITKVSSSSAGSPCGGRSRFTSTSGGRFATSGACSNGWRG